MDTISFAQAKKALEEIDIIRDTLTTYLKQEDIANMVMFDDLTDYALDTDLESLAPLTEVTAIKADLRQTRFNVKLYGALANGISNDSPAIQAALNDLEAIGGGFLIFPHGTYGIGQTIAVPSNVTLVGIGVVTFKRIAAINAMILNKSDGTKGGYTASTKIRLRYINFNANNAAIAGNTTSVAFGHASTLELEGCDFIGVTTWHDLELNGCRDVLVKKCTFPDYKGTTEALQLDYLGSAGQFPWFGPLDNTPTRDIQIVKCTFTSVGRTKTAIGNHTFTAGALHLNIHITNCIFEDFERTINLNDVTGLRIDFCEFINCVIGIQYEEKANAVRNWRIFHNLFYSNRAYSDTAFVDGRFFIGLTNVPVLGFEDVSINHNDIDKCLRHAIGLSITRGGDFSYNTIRNSPRNGIYIYGGKDITADHNKFVNNAIEGGSNADIVVGNNGGMAAENVTLSNNMMDKYVTGTNVKDILLTNNNIKGTITNNGGAEHTAKANIVAGVFTA